MFQSRKKSRKTIQEKFHKAYYESRVWLTETQWMGVTIAKNPLDLWVYQEIIHRCKPDLIIETGSYKGGSALFLGNMLDLVENGQVISIDIESHGRSVEHPRVEFWQGSSLSETILARLKTRVNDHSKVMVILDSDHSEEHVLEELDKYHSLVTPGQYLICEDSNVNGNPVLKEHGPGPKEALEKFLPQHPEFKVDASCEKFGMSFNPGGYLKRKATD